jgi:DNA-binding SARP family transcriptional activator
LLRLRTFGGVSIRREDPEPAPEAPVADAVLPRRALALLILLAATGEAGVTRDKLVAYLWPESDEDHARNALRQALHTLRHGLKATDSVTGGDPVRLDPRIVASDLEELETAFRLGKPERAIAVYAGPFLDGFHVPGSLEFERWVDERRAHYAGRVTSAVLAFAQAASKRGDTTDALAWWRRLVELDPLDSRGAAGLMRALAAEGHPAQALQHFRIHEALVGEELGVGPAPEVLAAGAEVRNGLTASIPAPPREPQGGAPEPPDRPVASLDRLKSALADGYAITAELDRGGAPRATRSFLAHDLRHDRPVVLRVIHPALASALDLQRFLAEIQLTARLQHHRLLPLLDSGQVEGRPWFTSPHLGGVTLRSRLSLEPVLSLPEALGIVRDVAEALDHVHRQGVLHRDVAPENILLVEGSALLTNLGVARALDAAGRVSLTETGVVVGSPAYMSPEQAAGERTLDARSDLFSLACVLYEMVAGEPLYSGPTAQAIMAKRSNAQLPRLLGLNSLPPPIHRAMLRALAEDPRRRFASAAEFCQALEEGGDANLPTASRRRRVRRALIALGMLLFGGALWALL